MSVELWINPFLDDFYEWGKSEYWNDKREFLSFLDTNPMASPYEDLKIKENGDVYNAIRIKNYIKENVPSWYYSNSFAMAINGGNLDTILNCWINDKPVLINNVVYMSYDQEEDYPKELKVGGRAIKTYQVYMGEGKGAFVKLLRVSLVNKGVRHYNALYFTGVKGKSWCNVKYKPNFINWVNRNPMEVKE